MNKLFYSVVALLILTTSCSKKQLINQLTGGKYSLTSYIKDNKDLTNEFLAEKTDYSIEFQEPDHFIESYRINGQVYQQITGEWNLINSNKDIQLVDEANNVRMFNIKSIKNKKLTLTKGNEEFKLER